MKKPIEILRDKYLLIENEKTVECHTHLVIEAMEEYLQQYKDYCKPNIQYIRKTLK